MNAPHTFFKIKLSRLSCNFPRYSTKKTLKKTPYSDSSCVCSFITIFFFLLSLHLDSTTIDTLLFYHVYSLQLFATFHISILPENWILERILKKNAYYYALPKMFRHFSDSNGSDEGLTLETSAFKLFTVANLRFQLSC